MKLPYKTLMLIAFILTIKLSAEDMYSPDLYNEPPDPLPSYVENCDEGAGSYDFPFPTFSYADGIVLADEGASTNTEYETPDWDTNPE